REKVSGVKKMVRRTFDYNDDGLRMVLWTDVSSTSRTKKATAYIKQTNTFTNINDQSSTLKGIFEVRPENSFVIEETINPSTGIPTKYTVSTGTSFFTHTSLNEEETIAFVRLDFTNLVFDLTGSDPCQPVSGEILRTLYSNENSSTILAQQSIVFDNKIPQVIGGDIQGGVADFLNVMPTRKCPFFDLK
ncbi:MAG: hypothetical protein K2X39_00205, partial [Silvanigrellaceae bacterium]|nr:hypothetical protein [Silvanigrellaceae bacterium]